jgi:hypothetical protein
MGFYFQSCRERVFWLKTRVYHPIHLWCTIHLYNPDYRTIGPSVLVLRSSCFGLLTASLPLLHIWRGWLGIQKWVGYWDVTLLVFYRHPSKRVVETIHQKIFQVIIQNIYGFVEKAPSLHSTKKGCCHYVQKVVVTMFKRFYKLSSRLFMGFYFRVCRESSFSASWHFWKGSVIPFIKRFYKLSSRIFMVFYFRVCRERVL